MVAYVVVENSKLRLHNPVALESHVVRVQLSCVPLFLNGTIEEVVGTRQTHAVLSLQTSPVTSANATDSHH